MKIPREMVYSSAFTIYEKHLYILLYDRYEYRKKIGTLINNRYMPVNISEVAETLEMSRPTVTKAIQGLCDKMILHKIKGEPGEPNLYEVEDIAVTNSLSTSSEDELRDWKNVIDGTCNNHNTKCD